MIANQDFVSMKKAYYKRAMLMTKVVLIAFFLSITSATNGAIIIDSDTTWEGQIRLEDDVQVASGATLTIAAGANIAWSDYEHWPDSGRSPVIEIFSGGKLLAHGSANNRVTFNNINIVAKGELDIQQAAFWGGEIMANSGGSEPIRIQESQLEDVRLDLYGNRAVIVSKNVLELRVRLQVGSDSRTEISNNLFLPHQWIPRGATYIEVNRGQGAVISGNTFTPHENLAYSIDFRASSENSSVDAKDNWFGTTDIETISSKIGSREDDLNKGVVNFTPVLDAVHPDVASIQGLPMRRRNRLHILVDQGVLGANPVIVGRATSSISGLTVQIDETTEHVDGIKTSHKLLVQDCCPTEIKSYEYQELELLFLPIVKHSGHRSPPSGKSCSPFGNSQWCMVYEFAPEFLNELAEYDPSLSDATFDQVLEIDDEPWSNKEIYDAIIAIAGSDGSYVD